MFFFSNGFPSQKSSENPARSLPKRVWEAQNMPLDPKTQKKIRFLSPKNNPGGINPHLKVMLLNYLQEQQFVSGLYMYLFNVLINHVYVFTLGENISGLRKPGGE